MIGADYSSAMVGRWACPAIDFIVATSPSGPILHDLDLDAVASQPETVEGGLRFHIYDPPFDRIYVVPSDATQSARVVQKVDGGGGSISGLQANGSGGVQNVDISLAGPAKGGPEQSCAPAPKVSLR